MENWIDFGDDIPAPSIEVRHATLLTRETLREDLRTGLDPLESRIQALEGAISNVREDVARLPTKDDLRELVVDKTDAMKGRLQAWILVTALGTVGSLSGVVFAVARLLDK